jgi:uncharacterized protein involved in exopolysaccharide biosynthesis
MISTDSRTMAVWRFLVALVLATLFSAATLAAGEPAVQPHAKAVVLVTRHEPAQGLSKSSDARVKVVEDYMATHAILLRSPLLLGRAVAKGKLGELKSLAGREVNTALAKGLSVQRHPHAPNVLVLTFTGADGKDGVAVLTALIEAYREYLEMTYRNVSDQTVELITRARDVLREDLRVSEDKYEQHRLQVAPPLFSSKNWVAIAQERMSALEAKKTALRIRQVEIQARVEALEKALKAGADPEALLKVWTGHSGTNKTPVDNKKPVEAARAYLTGLQHELEEARAIESGVDRLLEAQRTEAREITRHELQERHLVKDNERLSQLYDNVVKRLAEVNLARDSGGYDVRVLTPPHEAAVPQPAAQPAKAEVAPTADFAGKVVFVQTTHEAATLEKAHLTRLGDRSFLVGRVVRDDILTKGFFVGSTLYVPLSDVTRMAVFESLEQLKSSVRPR